MAEFTPIQLTVISSMDEVLSRFEAIGVEIPEVASVARQTLERSKESMEQGDSKRASADLEYAVGDFAEMLRSLVAQGD